VRLSYLCFSYVARQAAPEPDTSKSRLLLPRQRWAFRLAHDFLFSLEPMVKVFALPITSGDPDFMCALLDLIL